VLLTTCVGTGTHCADAVGASRGQCQRAGARGCRAARAQARVGRPSESWLGDLGALDEAERLEMAAEMRGHGVALGDRSKLRRLAAGKRTTGGAPSPGLPNAGHYMSIRSRHTTSKIRVVIYGITAAKNHIALLVPGQI
jgi:hypothetical protein